MNDSSADCLLPVSEGQTAVIELSGNVSDLMDGVRQLNGQALVSA